MASPIVQLLTVRRFAPLFVTQFLGAFNDNLLKSALGLVVTFRLDEQTGVGAASAGVLGARNRPHVARGVGAVVGQRPAPLCCALLSWHALDGLRSDQVRAAAA